MKPLRGILHWRSILEFWRPESGTVGHPRRAFRFRRQQTPCIAGGSGSSSRPVRVWVDPAEPLQRNIERRREARQPSSRVEPFRDPLAMRGVCFHISHLCNVERFGDFTPPDRDPPTPPRFCRRCGPMAWCDHFRCGSASPRESPPAAPTRPGSAQAARDRG